MFLRILRFVSRFIVRLIARVDILDADNIPAHDGVIVVSNHLGRLDAILAVILAEREDILMVIAEKYEQNPVWRWFGRRLNAIFIDRHRTDFGALRQVLTRLRAGELLVIAPEGTRSPTESLCQGKSGAAYLAAKAGVPVVPAAIMGTEDRIVREQLRRFRRLDITIRVGRPFHLPPLDPEDRASSLAQGTEEIMCRVAAILPAKYRGVYANHSRVWELLEENVRSAYDVDGDGK